MNIVEKIKNGQTELWLHDEQKEGYINGYKLYEYLREKNLLDECATDEDLIEIQKEGLKFFRKHFGRKYVYAWKSVRRRFGFLFAPCLYEDGDKVVLRWFWLGSDWDSNSPGLRHASSPKNSEFNSGLQFLELAIKTVKKAGYKVIKEL